MEETKDESYIYEMDSVRSSDGVVVRFGDEIELMDGSRHQVFWVGVHKPSYLSMIGILPQHEGGAVFFRQINRNLSDASQQED